VTAAASEQVGEDDRSERALGIEVDDIHIDIGRRLHRGRHREQLRHAEVGAAREEPARPDEEDARAIGPRHLASFFGGIIRRHTVGRGPVSASAAASADASGDASGAPASGGTHAMERQGMGAVSVGVGATFKHGCGSAFVFPHATLMPASAAATNFARRARTARRASSSLTWCPSAA
jgi:hypothetical protein